MSARGNGEPSLPSDSVVRVRSRSQNRTYYWSNDFHTGPGWRRTLRTVLSGAPPSFHRLSVTPLDRVDTMTWADVSRASEAAAACVMPRDPVLRSLAADVGLTVRGVPVLPRRWRPGSGPVPLDDVLLPGSSHAYWSART